MAWPREAPGHTSHRRAVFLEARGLAVVLLPLPASGCGLFSSERDFLGAAALSSGRELSRAEAEESHEQPPHRAGGGPTCLTKGPWAGLHSITTNGESQVTSLPSGAPPYTPQGAGSAECHLPSNHPSQCLFHCTQSFHPRGTGDG